MESAEYAALAAVEDQLWYFHALRRRIEGELLRHLDARPAEILDAGCGTGGLMRRLASRRPGWKWTGVDASAEACAYARAGAPGAIVQASLPRLPFPEGRFDAVVLADVLYHLEEDGAALRECRRVLRPGGLLVATVPAYSWLWSYHDEAVEGRRRYARREIREKMTQAGLAGVRANYWNSLFFPLLVLRRKVLPAPKSGSDVRAYPGALEALGRWQAGLEFGLGRVFGGLPFGGSILAVGMKADP